jgi:hypothetical protein
VNGRRLPVERRDLADDHVARIRVHLARFAAGHDPMGHLFAIERLARSARADVWQTQRRPESGRDLW